MDELCRDTIKFQSTHPVRGATGDASDPDHDVRFQSTHPVRGATLLLSRGHAPLAISIHAPREGCDVTHPSASTPSTDFNPRTP